MRLNSIRVEVLTDLAMEAKGRDAMKEVIQNTMLTGMKEGRDARQGEVKAALEALGLGGAAFKEEWEICDE